MSIQNKIGRGISRSFIGYSKCGHSLHTFVWLIGETMRAARSYLFKNKRRGTGRPMVLCVTATQYLSKVMNFSIPGRLWRLFEKARGRWEIAKEEKEGNRERIVLSLQNCLKPRGDRVYPIDASLSLPVTCHGRISHSFCSLCWRDLIGPWEMCNSKKTVSK